MDTRSSNRSAHRVQVHAVHYTLVLACLASCFMASTAGAQSRTREPERIRPGLLHLRRLDAEWEYEGSFDRFRVRSKDGTGRTNARQTNQTSLNRPVLTLRFQGDIVHPYLVDFYGKIGLGYSRSFYRERRSGQSRSDRSSGYLAEFDLRADLFKTKPVSGTVYGQRGEDRIPRLFLPTLRQRRTAYGTAWFHRTDRVLMELSFDHFETDRFGNRRSRDDERIVEDYLRYSLDWTIGPDEKLKLDYERSRRQQEFQGSQFKFDTRRDQLRLDYDRAFGDRKQHRFTAFARFQEESGDLARDIFEVSPQVILEHSKTLSTSYGYQFTRERLDGISVDQHRGDFQITHRFMKNLTTTFDVFVLDERTENDVQTTQAGASVAWQYTRSNPYGRLSADLRLSGDSEQTRGNSSTRLILNESGTFRDPLPVYLVRPAVARASVLVTDSTGRIVYRIGTDYLVSTLRDRTVLTRVPSGRIVNGQTVLVDYRYRTPRSGRIDTTRIDFSIQQDFESGWTPYYRINYRDQDVNRTVGFLQRADRTNNHRLGLTYSRPRWSWSAEYEIFDDTVEPYDAFHVTGNWNAIRTQDKLLDFRGRFSQYLFEGGFDKREVSEFNLSTVYEVRLSRDWTSAVSSSYRWEDDSVRGLTTAADIEAVLAYRYQNMSVELSLEYDLLRIAGSKEDGMSAWVNLRWALEDLLGTP